MCCARLLYRRHALRDENITGTNMNVIATIY